MRSKQRRLVWILLAAAVILLLLAAGAVALYFGLRAGPSDLLTWRNPRDEIVTEEVLPVLALYPLAGAAETETVDVALSQGEWETAHAILAFGLDLSDAQRIGRLVLLGAQMNEAEMPDRAAQVFQQVYDVAVLSPRLTDAARADALMAAGRGWSDAGYRADAVTGYDQVFRLAVFSPYLQMAQRRELLEQLRGAYEGLGDLDRAAACEQPLEELESVAPQPPATIADHPGLTLDNAAVSLAEVGDLEEARRQAALALVEDFAGGREPAAERVEALSAALKAEDAAKLSLYEQLLAETSQPERRAEALWALIRWLTIKYQVAMGGFGISLAPEWEGQVTEIQSGLSTRYEDLYFAYEDMVTALPDAAHLDQASYLVRREMNLAGRLGHYPNFPMQQMADKLQDAALKLVEAEGPERLFVDVLVQDGQSRFFLSTGDVYGQSPQSP